MTERQEKPPQKSNIQSGSLDSLVEVSDVHFNVSQKVIITTEDKVRIHLSTHLNKVEKKKGWIAPLGILITIIITLVTSDFKSEGSHFSAPTWEAIFVVSGILSFGWLIYSIKQAMNSESLEELIEHLKKKAD